MLTPFNAFKTLSSYRDRFMKTGKHEGQTLPALPQEAGWLKDRLESSLTFARQVDNSTLDTNKADGKIESSRMDGVILDGEYHRVPEVQNDSYTDSMLISDTVGQTDGFHRVSLSYQQQMPDQSMRSFEALYSSNHKSHLIQYTTIQPDGTGTSSTFLLGEQPKPLNTEGMTLKEVIATAWNKDTKAN